MVPEEWTVTDHYTTVTGWVMYVHRRDRRVFGTAMDMGYVLHYILAHAGRNDSMLAQAHMGRRDPGAFWTAWSRDLYTHASDPLI